MQLFAGGCPAVAATDPTSGLLIALLARPASRACNKQRVIECLLPLTVTGPWCGAARVLLQEVLGLLHRPTGPKEHFFTGRFRFLLGKAARCLSFGTGSPAF